MNEATIKQLEDELSAREAELAKDEQSLLKKRELVQALHCLLSNYRGAMGAKRTVVRHSAILSEKDTTFRTTSDRLIPPSDAEVKYAIEAISTFYPEWSTTGLTRKVILTRIQEAFKWEEPQALALTEQLQKSDRIFNKGRRWYPKA